MKNKTICKLLTVLIIGLSTVFISCDKEEDFNPQITVVNSTNEDISGQAKGFPGDLIIVEGVELDKMDKIELVAGEYAVEVVFNPSLNSSKAIMFNVPFSEAKGSQLGMQEIVFTNKQGKKISTDFEILQPEPEITGFDPERPKAGESTIIKGNWFQNLQSVTFAGITADYEQLSSTEIFLEIPEGSEPDDVVVTTTAGSSTKSLDVDLGYNVYLYNDFDGGGLYATNEWWNSGDITDAAVFSSDNGFNGNYIEVKWSGSTTNGWGNCEPSAGANPNIVETNQADVIFVFEAYCVSAAGTSMQIQIDDGLTVWAYNYTFAADEVGKWVTVEMSTYDFGRGYDPSNQTHDMDIQSISKIKIAINGWTGVVPSTVRVDNMRFHAYY